MRPVMLLAQLNGVDLEVEGLRTRLAQIAAALHEPGALKAAREALETASGELSRWQAAQQEREAVQAKASAKLARTEQRLYGGQVRNPKELQDLQSDQEQLRRQLRQSEDELLDALVAVEGAASERERCQAEVNRLAGEWTITQAGLRAEQASLSSQLPVVQARQAAYRRAVPAEFLSIYDALRPRRGGRAVAEVDGGVCTACRVAVPPSKIHAARDGSELTYCDNCGRLLWGE
jgi:hypothetical protein